MCSHVALDPDQSCPAYRDVRTLIPENSDGVELGTAVSTTYETLHSTDAAVLTNYVQAVEKASLVSAFIFVLSMGFTVFLFVSVDFMVLASWYFSMCSSNVAPRRK